MSYRHVPRRYQATPARDWTIAPRPIDWFIAIVRLIGLAAVVLGIAGGLVFLFTAYPV